MHLPLKVVPLRMWIENLQEHPNICAKYGFALSSNPVVAEVKSPECMDEEPATEVEETPEMLDEIVKGAAVAEMGLARQLNETVKKQADPVSPHQAQTVSN